MHCTYLLKCFEDATEMELLFLCPCPRGLVHWYMHWGNKMNSNMVLSHTVLLLVWQVMIRPSHAGEGLVSSLYIYLLLRNLHCKNDGVIFTPFRSDDHSKAIHSWGVTALWSDHHSIWWSDLIGVVKLMIGK